MNDEHGRVLHLPTTEPSRPRDGFMAGAHSATEKAVGPAPVPCAQCREIKTKRYDTVRQGDRRLAEAMATAMGRHQRAAHS